MSVEKKVPEIRFKGFSGEWDEKILGELVQLENGFAFQSKYFKKSPTNVIVLTPGSVNIGGGFQSGKGQYYDTKQEVPTRYVFRPNDMFITMTDLTPTAQALGFPAVVPEDDNTYLHNQRLGKLVGFQGDMGFLYNLLRTTKKQKEIVATSSGTTVKHTSPDKFLNRFCFFPESQEQTQIGNTFQKLDSLINQHQQKHDKLSNIKKAMLEKMFPKQGETIPEIRFKGFSGEWEEKELGAIGSFASGVGFSESEQSGRSGTPFFKVSDMNLIGNECYMVTANNYVNDEQISRLNYTPIRESSILFAKVGAAIFLERKRIAIDFLIDNNMMAFSPTQDIIFMKQWFDSISLAKYTQVGALPSFKATDLGKIKLKIPKREEQTAIGKYFQKLDVLIKHHQQQITKLNNIKQACLSKMFV